MLIYIKKEKGNPNVNWGYPPAWSFLIAAANHGSGNIDIVKMGLL